MRQRSSQPRLLTNSTAFPFPLHFHLSRVLLVQSQVREGGHETERVRVAHSTAPALHAHDRIALVQHTQVDGVLDAPLEATVDVLLPWHLSEVGLRLVEEEGIHATVEVGVLDAMLVPVLLGTYSLLGRGPIGLDLLSKRVRCG